MPGFTSTTLVSLVVAAIGRIDPNLGSGIARPDPMMTGVTPDTERTSLLANFVAKHGTTSVLHIGQHLDLAEEAPVLSVLAMSPDPSLLADKWMRLERYHHSSHRTVIDPSRQHMWTCTRRGTAAPAGLAENLLIAGVLFGLLERLGAEDCRLRVEGQTVSAESFGNLELRGACAEFALLWSADQASDHTHGPVTGNIADTLADLLARDIGRSWRLKDAAKELAFSERSLQRHLGRSGRNFSSVLRRARMREATQLLAKTDTSLAEIGYCCGYADQAHFQRDFQRVANMTPRTFRDVSRS
ncbi:MAG: helix-turn-helix transcriptional regulator [Pseudomonadota bacterium]